MDSLSNDVRGNVTVPLSDYLYLRELALNKANLVESDIKSMEIHMNNVMKEQLTSALKLLMDKFGYRLHISASFEDLIEGKYKIAHDERNARYLTIVADGIREQS